MDLLDLFERGSGWTASKVPAAVERLEYSTPCESWDVRTLLNHMLDTQRYFVGTARGEEASLPTPDPPDAIGSGDPLTAFNESRDEMLTAYAKPGVIEKTGPSLGIAFVDQLVHGWDLAEATGQDSTMPDDLAAAAFAMIDGQLTEERRSPGFRPAVNVGDDAPAQAKLLAYTGRQP